MSPYRYANGVDTGPVVDATSPIISAQKLGILIIDHGSRLQASNYHIHNVARMYKNRLDQKKDSDVR